MKIYSDQLRELSIQTLQLRSPIIHEYFVSLIQDGTLEWENGSKELEVFIDSKMKLAFQHEVLNEAGLVKFVYISLLFGEKNLFPLYEMLKSERAQDKKNEKLDSFFLNATNFGNYWKL